MAFLKSLIIAAGVATALYQIFFGDDKSGSPPPRSPPPSPPQHDQRRYYQTQCECSECRSQRQWQQRPPVQREPKLQQLPPQQILRQPQSSSPVKLYQPPVPQQHSKTVYAEAVSYNENSDDTDDRDSYYVSLRNAAKKAGDLMSKYFDDSKTAYNNGNHTRAKELSNIANQYKTRMEDMNKKASEWIFAENNRDNEPCKVDLHGLYVKEATTFTDRALKQARARGDPIVRLIVGKGLHSKNGDARLKPEIEKHLRALGHSPTTDPRNAGVLAVQLSSHRRSSVDEYAYRDDADYLM